MNLKDRKIHKSGLFCLLAALVTFLFSLTVNTSLESSDKLAVNLAKKIEKRIALMDKYAQAAFDSDHSDWLDLKNVPEDIVIYRYVYDTLQSWCNQFPILNDNIGTRVFFHRLSNFRTGFVSPLSEITQKPHYLCLGSKWYIVKMMSDGMGCKVICGLEVKNTLLGNLQNSNNGVNPILNVPGNYDILPLINDGGSAVIIDGEPLFKVVSETTKDFPVPANAILRWFALLFFVMSLAFYLTGKPTIKRFCAVSFLLAVCAAISFVWGLQMQNISVFFSPTIYADGPVLFSFGALMIINIFIFLFVLCMFITRKSLRKFILDNHTKLRIAVYVTSIIVLLAALTFYIHYSIRSLIMNSGITLEIYQWNSFSPYSMMFFLSYSLLFFSIVLLLQLLRPVMTGTKVSRYNVFSKKFLFGFSIVCALYVTVIVALLGFEKEENRVSVWTNRLAVERDLSLEIQLKSIEEAIASDPLIATMSELPHSNSMILHRLNDNYFFRISQGNNITVTISKENDNIVYDVMGEKIPCLAYFHGRMMEGTPISDGSRFVYLRDMDGSTGYVGAFIYHSESAGLIHMFIEIEAKTYRGDNGYASIMRKQSRPDEVNIPMFYSYAKYISGKLVNFRGTYPYPTVLGDDIDRYSQNGVRYFRSNGYIHFVNVVANDEIILISRGGRGLMSYFITFSYLIIILYSLLVAFSLNTRKEKNAFKRKYYRSRINFVLFVSLSLTLVVMAAVSISFVFRRNETNMFNLMSSKISTLQALLEQRCKYARDFQDLNTSDFAGIMESIGNTTKLDVSLYTPSGRIFRSTAPEIFEKMLIGSRLNQNAYYNIKYRHQRFYIEKEEIAGQVYYAMYAPLFNAEGTMLAIINAPFSDGSYIFKRDAFFHGATIINLFIILLFATLLLSSTIVDAMFKPLTEMGKKMNSADIHGLEYITYDRKDEISTLVEAYNRMVKALSESTVKLTQAERDKAWSEMARQVAHEIKNPLTPIKLEIQRLIRLKQKNDPAWDEKFDKVSAVVLEHIDILSDTANEFSTFAKLYTEEPVSMNLDASLKEQLLIFDNKDNIRISYIGLSDSFVLAPRPQLIRVFVNLITNAIQAIEIMQKEQEDAGKEIELGRLVICVRNSIRDGFYDVVFEDNGPGVSEDNLGKLFTPNFTTKSGGTGLGLAICRNIIEKCNGTISYQKSFAFKGACFTVQLPKEQR